MATIIERFQSKRDSIKTVENLKSFVLAEMPGYAFSITFPNGDSAMGIGVVNFFLNAPSQYAKIRPIYQVGDSEEDLVKKVTTVLPRMLREVRDIEEQMEAERLEGIIHYKPPGSLRKDNNRVEGRRRAIQPSGPSLEDSFPKAERTPARKRSGKGATKVQVKNSPAKKRGGASPRSKRASSVETRV